MNVRGQLIVGSALVLFGLVFLIGTVFQINIWSFCFPIGLIVAGIWLVTRPSFSRDGRDTQVLIIGELRRRGSWSVRNQEFWMGISDVDFDFASAEISPGETRISFFSFVGDIDIFVPRDVGVSVRTFGFFMDTDLLGRELESFLSPIVVTSENYATTERRLIFEMTGFVNDVKVRYI
jgi:lia operon protein LiaF